MDTIMHALNTLALVIGWGTLILVALFITVIAWREINMARYNRRTKKTTLRIVANSSNPDFAPKIGRMHNEI